jgi:hypothetical protein
MPQLEVVAGGLRTRAIDATGELERTHGGVRPIQVGLAAAHKERNAAEVDALAVLDQPSIRS